MVNIHFPQQPKNWLKCHAEYERESRRPVLVGWFDKGHIVLKCKNADSIHVDLAARGWTSHIVNHDKPEWTWTRKADASHYEVIDETIDEINSVAELVSIVADSVDQLVIRLTETKRRLVEQGKIKPAKPINNDDIPY